MLLNGILAVDLRLEPVVVDSDVSQSEGDSMKVGGEGFDFLLLFVFLLLFFEVCFDFRNEVRLAELEKSLFEAV